MTRLIFRRILESVPTLFVLITLTFFVMKAVPGGPFDGEKALPEEIRANIDAKFHFDEPVWKQYIRYVSNLAHGDFGPSYRFLGGRDVAEIICDGLPISMQLGGLAILLSILVGIPLGVLSAYAKGSWLDFSFMVFAVAGVSLPNFLVASLLILVFSVHLNWLPPALLDDWTSYVLPVVTLALRPLSLIARLTRASVIEALQMDYVRTARAKGLSFVQVLFKHALKNALVPVITLLGPLAAALITGSFVVEVMFALPGLGKYFVSAVIDRDYTVIMGVTIVYGIIVVVFNLLVDVLYGWIDPRISA